MYRARHKLDKSHLINLYNTLVLPHLLYCNTVWSVANKSCLETLFTCQKKIIKCIYSNKNNESYEALFMSSGILDIYQISLYSSCLFMYKFYTENLPSLFDSYFTYAHDVHDYDTRRPISLRPPSFRSNLSKSFIKYRGVVIWNNITKLCNVNVKLSTFKVKVKTLIKEIKM